MCYNQKAGKPQIFLLSEPKKRKLKKLNDLFLSKDTILQEGESVIALKNPIFTQENFDVEKNEIKEKETEVKDRMYSMQTVNNSNSFVDYLFGANNFTDIFSRVSNINELTSYDNELIKEIYDNKKELEKQKNTISTAKKNLETQREQQYQLQIKYNELLNKQ